jgi:glucose/arabinose dehydrogenase
MRLSSVLAALSPLALGLASCGSAPAGDKPSVAADTGNFTYAAVARFNEPWAMTFIPGTPYALITEKRGRLKLWQDGGGVRDVAGVPKVAYGGQGGFGDVQLAPDYARTGTIYLSWAEAGGGGKRGAVVGKAHLGLGPAPRLEGLQVIWRQQPKTTGEGQYSYRLAFSPDGKYLFVSSGERQKFTPAQDMSGNLGKIVRLLPDGTPAPGNPFAARDGVTAQIWTLGHRNPMGMKFDDAGRLWEVEMGPMGGDELDLIKPGRNYGWPLVSEGDNYDGTPIPRHSTRPDLAAPALSWNPVIAPGDFIFYRGNQFPAWRGQAVIAAMKPAGIVRVAIQGESAREVSRMPMPHRVREIVEREDGSVWLLEDGEEAGAGRLLRLSPAGR